MKTIPQKELNAYANLWNAKRAQYGAKSEKNLEIFLATLNLYLRICQDQGFSEEQYTIIKNALQDIADWYIIGLDVETFEYAEPKDESVQQRTLIELD